MRSTDDQKLAAFDRQSPKESMLTSGINIPQIQTSSDVQPSTEIAIPIASNVKHHDGVGRKRIVEEIGVTRRFRMVEHDGRTNFAVY